MNHESSILIQALAKEVPALNRLNSEEKIALEGKVLQFIRAESHYYSGPIPSPDQLEKFNKIIPDGADRILKMAENQSAHRIKCESVVINSQQRQSNWGQILAFVLVSFLIIAGSWLTHEGHDAVGGTIFGTTIAGVAITFITSKHRQSNDLQKKKQGNP